MFYVENTKITGGSTAVDIGKDVTGCLKNVKFDQCKECIENDGDIELFGNSYCGKALSSASDGTHTQKENGNFTVSSDFFN